MKNIGLIIMMVCSVCGMKAQSVIGSMGGDLCTEYGGVSQTVGQPADNSVYDTALTINTRTSMMGEGVQQPYLSWELLGVSGAEMSALRVNIYPNPTVDGFVIEVSEDEKRYQYELYSMNGALLQQGVMRGRCRVDMEAYATGSYMLRLSTMDREEERNYKIIKGH